MSSPQSPLRELRRVRVGSRSSPKVAAVRAAIAAYAPSVVVEGAQVESGVPGQPVGFDEIVRGARGRARAAFDLGGCELAVGYEDGLVEIDPGSGAASGGASAREPGREFLNVGCAIATDGIREAIGFSSGFAYPPELAERAVRERLPIGDLFDALWAGRSRAGGDCDSLPSGEGEGNIGKLSLGVLTRSEYARHAVLGALVRFLHPDLYFGDRGGAALETDDRSVA